MFERFTRQAREVLIRAQVEARELRHDHIGAEHLFLGVLSQRDAPGVAALTRLGITPDGFRSQTQDTLGSPEGLGPTDADALRALGIDLNEVRRRVEASFGPGALDKPLRIRRGWLPWRRRCVEPVGHIPFTPRAKQVLEVALREAIHRKDRHIGVQHILLALFRVKGSVALEVLTRLGAEPEAVRQEVLRDLDQAA